MADQIEWLDGQLPAAHHHRTAVEHIVEAIEKLRSPGKRFRRNPDVQDSAASKRIRSILIARIVRRVGEVVDYPKLISPKPGNTTGW
jgi:hypothetical protein